METKQHPQGWKAELQAIINSHNRYRADHFGRRGIKIASAKMQQERANFLFKFMTDLRALGYRVSPENVREKHIHAICEKFEADGLAAPTIQTYLSFLRAFCGWIGKKGLIRDPKIYFKNPKILERTYAASEDKSWDIPGLDKERLLGEISVAHPHVWMQLLMCDAFGLRRKEAVMLRPYLDEREGRLYVMRGAKGGRERSIPIESAYQRQVLEMAKHFVDHSPRDLGDPKLDLNANLKKFSNVMTKFGIRKSGKGALGITAHGLRAGFAMRKMEEKGLANPLSQQFPDRLPPQEEARIRREVSELLGHWRPAVMNAYVPPNTPRSLEKIRGARDSAIASALEKLRPGMICRVRYRDHVAHDGTLVSAASIEKKYLQVVSLDFDWALQLADDGAEQQLVPLEAITRLDL